MSAIDGEEDEVDLFEQEDYNPIEHLNRIFAHPSTLGGLQKTHRYLQAHQDDLADEIELLAERQGRQNAECLARMQASQLELSELLQQIDGVRERARQTERQITEMTADIKRLDNSKKNLTLSMTALKRLQMLTTAYEQLRDLVKTRQYKECSHLMQAVIQLMAFFRSYRSIDQIAMLGRHVADIQREALEQICEDFELIFAKEEVHAKRSLLQDACLVVDALGDSARSRLVTWYCNTELRQYRTIFKVDQEAGSLDNIDRRYAWFRKTFKLYQEEHAFIFPPHWQVGSILAHVFAENTKDDYKTILGRSTRNGQSIDVRMLLNCLQQTLDFEQALDQRLSDNPSRMSIDTVTSASDGADHKVLISDAFRPYLGLWVDQQAHDLELVVQEYKGRPVRKADDEFNSEHVIPSSTELIKLYQLALVQCAKLSTGQPLLDLSRVFARQLDQYAQGILLANLAEKPTAGTPSKLPTVEDIVMVLNTADYCNVTTGQLEEKIKSRIDPDLAGSIDFSAQSDTFLSVASTGIRALVRQVETALEPCWREMRNVPYSKIEICENNSSYIPRFRDIFNIQAGRIVSYMHKPQYSRAFADHLLDAVSQSFLLNIVQCRPITTAGAEQMLLDTHEIRKIFLNLLPSPSTSYNKRVAAAFGRIEPLLKTLQVFPSPPEALVQAYLIHLADRSDVNFRKVLDLKGIRGRSEQAQLMELFQMHKMSARYAESTVETSGLLSQLVLGSNLAAHTPAPAPSTPISNLQAFGSSAAASLSTASIPTLKFLPDPTQVGGLGTAIKDRLTGGGSPALRSEAFLTSPPRNNSVPSLAVTPARSSDETGNTTPSLASDGIANGLVSNGEPSSASVEGQGGKVQENLKSLGKFFKRDASAAPFGTSSFNFGRFGRQSPSTSIEDGPN